MKTLEIKKLKPEEIEHKIIESTEELDTLRFKVAKGEEKNNQVIRKTRRTIARFHTVLGELKGETNDSN